MSDRDDSQIQSKKSRYPKYRGFNILTVGEGKDRSFYCLDCNYAEGVGIGQSNNTLSKSRSSRIITNQVKPIIDEIGLLISKRKNIEADFEKLRKKTFDWKEN